MGSSCSLVRNQTSDDLHTPPPSVVSIAIQTDSYPVPERRNITQQVANPNTPTQVANPLAPNNNRSSLDPSEEIMETVECGSNGEKKIVIRGSRSRVEHGTDACDVPQIGATAPNSSNTMHITHDADADDDNSDRTTSHSETHSKAAHAPLSPQTLHFPSATSRIATAVIRDDSNGGDTPQHGRAQPRTNGEAQQPQNSSATTNIVFQSFYLGPSFEAHPTAQGSSGNYSSGAFPAPQTNNGGRQNASLAAVTTSMNGYVGESTSFRTRGTSLSSAATELKSSTETKSTATSGASEKTSDSFGVNPNKQPGGAQPPPELKLTTFYQR